MVRIIENLGYGLIACGIVGGAWYGLMRYADSAAPAAVPQAVVNGDLNPRLNGGKEWRGRCAVMDRRSAGRSPRENRVAD